MSKDDGGPAFPQTAEIIGYHDTQNFIGTPGMSLRDWFAGQVLVAIVSDDCFNAAVDCEFTYKIADFMLEARGK